MIKTIFYFFAGTIFFIFFTGCKAGLFPKKLVYSVSTGDSLLPGKKSISPDLMKAEGYRNNLNFYNGGNRIASLILPKPGPLPPGPKPCEPARCKILRVSLVEERYILTIEGYKDFITLKLKDVNEIFISSIKETPDRQFILHNPTLEGD